MEETPGVVAGCSYALGWALESGAETARLTCARRAAVWPYVLVVEGYQESYVYGDAEPLGGTRGAGEVG